MEVNKITSEIFSKLEQQWLSKRENHKKTRVLTIDGGGTTAITSAAALMHLEHQIQLKTGNSNSRIVDFFDIIAGTGTGALLAALINVDDGSGTGRSLFTAKQAVKFLTEKQAELYKLKTVGVVHRRRKYSGKSMEKVLQQALIRNVDGKVLTLTDTCKPFIVPCFDLISGAPFVFSRTDASESASFNFDLWKVIRATSSDPSMLKPFKLTSIDGKTSCTAVDGGLVMNNPSAAVVTHVLNNKRDFPLLNGVEDLLVLSLGNGQLTSPQLRKVNGNGYCKNQYVVNVVRDGVSETVDQMLSNAFCLNRMNYVRIQTNGYGYLKGVGPTMEEVLKERGIETLPFGGKRLLNESNGEIIESFVQNLIVSGTISSLPPSPCKSIAVSQLVNGR